MDNLSRAVSLFAVYLLDRVGYSQDVIQNRRMCYQMIGVTNTPSGFTQNFVGSKGEGTSSFDESDIDILNISNDLFCCEEGLDRLFRHKHPWIFTVNTDLVSPGYCLLFLSQRGFSNWAETALVPFDGETHLLCLSSTKFIDKSMSEYQLRASSYISVGPRAGPSTPLTSRYGSDDMVLALQCHCPTLLHDWLVRPRPYDWPSWELRVEVVRLGANLCPVGCKDDAFHDLQWRFCFNLGEIKLVQSWNEVQTKLYIILKMLLKQEIKPENKEITSYTMKNVVFWLCERHPQSQFSCDSLIYWTRKALLMLKQSIQLNVLPYYMIPGRNLLKPLKDDVKTTLATTISRIVLDPFVGIQCKKLNIGMRLFEKQSLDIVGHTRNMAEMVLIKEVQNLLILQNGGTSAEETESLSNKLREVQVRINTVKQQMESRLLGICDSSDLL